MVDENNIFLLEKPVYLLDDKPINYDEVKKEIINLLKENDFSISYSAGLFKQIINELSKTPINQL